MIHDAAHSCDDIINKLTDGYKLITMFIAWMLRL